MINLAGSTQIKRKMDKNSNEVQSDLGKPLELDYLPNITEPQPKRRKITSIKHRTSEEEMEILSEVKIYKDKLPDDGCNCFCSWTFIGDLDQKKGSRVVELS